MTRALIAVIAAACAALITACSSGPQPSVAAPSDTTSSTTSVAASSTSTSAADPKGLFLRVMRDRGLVKTSIDEALVLAEGDLYCRGLRDGLSRRTLLDNAGLPGSAARVRAELVFPDAVVALCPEQSARATQ
ncbi:hypothetical protein EDD40_1564 [Saccharothrix texasensis]|uniref:DUF732 domain-containing protein n=2 Tax=Saccharothrix texasensis TaxID=103734 RepID=A0A3N1H1E5_9PSEU|nr:hypothetical protein EDD40_1564 [Saccharothrix texasensis]